VHVHAGLAQAEQQAGAQAVRHRGGQQPRGVGSLSIAERFRLVHQQARGVGSAEVDQELIALLEFNADRNLFRVCHRRAPFSGGRRADNCHQPLLGGVRVSSAVTRAMARCSLSILIIVMTGPAR
jgi:hypothetical protein